jgi:hypothetical protein
MVGGGKMVTGAIEWLLVTEWCCWCYMVTIAAKNAGGGMVAGALMVARVGVGLFSGSRMVPENGCW